MTGSGAGDTGGPYAVDAFERIADALRDVRNARSSGGVPIDVSTVGDAERDAELDSAIAHLERLIQALAGLATPADHGEGPLDRIVVAFENGDLEAQASVLLTDLWNAADGALRSVVSGVARIGEANATAQEPDRARRLSLVGRSAADVAAAFHRFLIVRAAVASEKPMGSEPQQPTIDGATEFVAALLDLVDRVAHVARSVIASGVAVPIAPGPRVVLLPPLPTPRRSWFRSDVPEPAAPKPVERVPEREGREPESSPIVRPGSLPFEPTASAKVPSWTPGVDEPPVRRWTVSRPMSRPSRRLALVAVAIMAIGATATIGAQMLGGEGWQRLLGAVGVPSSAPSDGVEPGESAPGAGGSPPPGGESAAPGSEGPGTTAGGTNTPGAPTPTPDASSSPGPSSSPGTSPSPGPSQTPGPSQPPPTPGPTPTPTPAPTPTLDPAVAAQQFADRVRAATASILVLLDEMSASVEAADYAAVKAAAQDLAVRANTETAWLGSHPPAACYSQEHGDALVLYAELLGTANAIATSADAQDSAGIKNLIASGRQDRAALNTAANHALVGC